MSDAGEQRDDESNLFRARYARETPALPSNDVVDVILAHRSWRSFKSDPLPDGMLETLLAAAQSAATSSNLQSWSVVAIQDKARLRELMEIGDNQKHIADAPLTLCFLCDLSRLANVADRINHKRDALDYLESFVVGAIDSALAAQNLCVAAESFGLGTCYLGALRHEPERMAAFLKLPPMTMVTFGLTIGWPDETKPAFMKPRLPQSSVLHHDVYDPAQAIAPVSDYEIMLDKFNKLVRNGQPLWGLRSAGRVAGPESLNGRQNLKAALRRLGFPLL